MKIEFTVPEGLYTTPLVIETITGTKPTALKKWVKTGRVRKRPIPPLNVRYLYCLEDAIRAVADGD